MEIKLFSLVKNESAENVANKTIISDCVGIFTQKNERFKNFSSPKRMIIASAQALKIADSVVIAVNNSSYNTIKKMVCSAFNIETEQNPVIYSYLFPLFEKGKISKTLLENNTCFPKGAEIFPTSDYRNCGFSITAGAQSIIIIPIDSVRTADVVFGSLYDYFLNLSDAEDKEEIVELKRYYIAKRLVSLLRNEETKVCFTSLGGSKLLNECFAKTDRRKKYLLMGNKPAPRQAGQSVKDYVVASAQKTRIESDCEYACAVSSVFVSNNDDSAFIYYAVADENETIVSKLYLMENEEPKALYPAGVDSVLLAVGDKIINNIKKSKCQNKKEDKALRKKLSLLTAASIAGVTAVSVLMALFIS